MFFAGKREPLCHLSGVPLQRFGVFALAVRPPMLRRRFGEGLTMVAKKKAPAKKKTAVKKVAKKTAKKAASKVVKKAVKKRVKKSAKKSARRTSVLTKLERSLYERMVELDLLAADMGLAGSLPPKAPRKSKKSKKKL
jgi:hypothetical protein